ncbi:MAG: phosphate acyltransferase PlsX, partial [Clostridia bacterium]|nr:phosphate acyltransferase PlsX [Clostridia bacterium]
GCEVVLVGDSAQIEPLLEGKDRSRVSIVHTTEVITNEEKATSAVRAKKDSSMSVALKLVADGEADAVVSAGSTGALLTGATFIVKRIKGIQRGALGTVLPTKGQNGVMLLDCGANAECTAEYLLQFGFLGSLYMNKVEGVQCPRVALLNNGTEEGKGDPLRKEAFELLKQASDEGRINFVGNVEGRDILSGDCDVLVCDGFSGTIALKSVEGSAMFVMRELKHVLYKNILSKIAALLVKPGLFALKDKMDYNKVGGAPFLGISGPVIKAHGSSNEESYCSAIGQAIRFVEGGFIKAVCENIEYMSVKKD